MIFSFPHSHTPMDALIAWMIALMTFVVAAMVIWQAVDNIWTSTQIQEIASGIMQSIPQFILARSQYPKFHAPCTKDLTYSRPRYQHGY